MTERTVLKISRRNLVTATAIVPAAAIRGSAANSAVTVGLIGCGGRGTHDAGLLVKEVPNARLVALADVFEDRVARTKKATGVGNVKEYPSGDALLSAGSVDVPGAPDLPAATASLLASAPALQLLTLELVHLAGVNPDLIRREEAPYREAARIAESGFPSQG